MPRRRRTEQLDAVAQFQAEAGLDPAELARLRDERDPDPLLEEATERLRAALVHLDARDEWGRRLAWRQVARIALGPVVTQLRDSQTATRLLEATRPATDDAASGSAETGDEAWVSEELAALAEEAPATDHVQVVDEGSILDHAGDTAAAGVLEPTSEPEVGWPARTDGETAAGGGESSWWERDGGTALRVVEQAPGIGGPRVDPTSFGWR